MSFFSNEYHNILVGNKLVNSQYSKLSLTDRSGAANKHLSAESDAGSLAGVDGDRKRLQKRAFFQSHVIRQFVAEVSSMNVKAS